MKVSHLMLGVFACILGTSYATATKPHVKNLPQDLAVSSTSTEVKPTPLELKELKNWSIELNDKVVSATINRWVTTEGYILIWDSKVDFQIQTPSVLRGSLKSVINEVLKSFKASGSPLRANWYTNKVIKITGVNNTSSMLDNVSNSNSVDNL